MGRAFASTRFCMPLVHSRCPLRNGENLRLSHYWAERLCPCADKRNALIASLAELSRHSSRCRVYSVVKYSATVVIRAMKLREVLAANLKRYRLAAGLSQEELAHRADLDRTYVSSLERGRYSASVDKIEQLAARSALKPAELLVRSARRQRDMNKAEAPPGRCRAGLAVPVSRRWCGGRATRSGCSSCRLRHRRGWRRSGR